MEHTPSFCEVVWYTNEDGERIKVRCLNPHQTNRDLWIVEPVDGGYPFLASVSDELEQI